VDGLETSIGAQYAAALSSGRVSAADCQLGNLCGACPARQLTMGS